MQASNKKSSKKKPRQKSRGFFFFLVDYEPLGCYNKDRREMRQVIDYESAIRAQVEEIRRNENAKKEWQEKGWNWTGWEETCYSQNIKMAKQFLDYIKFEMEMETKGR